MGRGRSNCTSFFPTQNSKIKGWLRAAATTPTGTSYAEWVDVLNSNPAVQATSTKRPSTSTSTNGLPVVLFDGGDLMQWPLSASINNMTDKFGLIFRFKPAVVNTIQRLFNATIAAGASVGFEKFSIYLVNRTLVIEIYITNATGRTVTTGNIFLAGEYTHVYFQYDSSRGGDANAVIYADKTLLSPSFGNIGVGGTLAALQAPTGNMI